MTPADSGTPHAAEALMPVVYTELRRLAGRYIRRERAVSVQATELVHDAYLRLLKDHRPAFQDRTHFLAIAALCMRRLLVERARARGAAKRGGSEVRVTLDETLLASVEPAIDVLAIDGALTRLAAVDPKHARVVELRFFGGLTVEETAAAMNSSPATVKRQWTLAKAWLMREMRPEVPRQAP
jgi:RNA polymerase sigma-70 factor (ECF subfamily)